jgi:hypothetical protein
MGGRPITLNESRLLAFAHPYDRFQEKQTFNSPTLNIQGSTRR